MRFSAALFALASATAAFATDITVQVGANGFTFTPSNITTQNGDNVIFEFHAKNHSVTQSTFAAPCTFMNTPTVGVSSGFQPVNTTTGPFPTWNITISNSSAPLWFYCAQTNPASHCNAGMVFAINPSAAKSFAAFQAAAEAAGGNTTAAGSATSSGSGVAATTLSIAPTGGATGAGSVGASTGSGSATQSAQSTTPTNGAMRMGASASGLLAFVGLVTGLML